MAKQLNIDMSIRADTSQAKQAMMDLQKSLDTILSKRTITIDDTSINQAKQAAMDLKHHLAAATDVNTGKLDLSKFSASLNKSKQSLQGLYNNLSQIGPEGQSAFLALSQSIARADASAISLGGKLGGLMTTLKNTAKWQISSSLLHGFIGAIQSAYGYAQDLNESLNNIRIVTGQSIDQMAQFAKEANNAAKALSTTTVEYTNASLIYYQQGLSDQQVKARTDATIKLANVSRQSAEEVSSQMTSIWNNFAKGNENLEYYEDVIAKLGATTASSSSEIAEGVSKFASVADTVDLSYEKATASLATVVAETRQSADTVGTAFKTLFARVEGLKLGETLEDGTDLNKYSKALATVGVNIKDQSGELKSMDTILDDIGAKWTTLNKDQQVALAQTVAGVRQYTQFISLMDNYDKVLKNEQVAKGSSGTVDEQAQIYAESWEAARDRVTAAAEEIYNQLLDDKAFISILNGFEKFLEFISNVIDGLGGLKGILLLISSIFMQQYAKEMPAFIEKMTMNIRILTGEEEKRRQVMLKENADIINNQMGKSGSAEVDIQVAGMKKISAMYADLASKRKTLSQAEIASYENLIKETEARAQIAQAIGKEIDLINKETSSLEVQLKGQMGYNNRTHTVSSTIGNENFQGNKDVVNEGLDLVAVDEEKKLNILKEQQKEYINIQSILDQHSGDVTSLNEKQQETLKNLKQQYGSLEGINAQVDKTSERVDGIREKLTGADLFKAFKNGATEIGKVQTVLNHVTKNTERWTKAMDEAKDDPQKIATLRNELTAYSKKMEEAGMDTTELKTAIDQLGSGGSIRDVIDSFQNLGEQGIELSADKLEKLKFALENLGMDANKLNELQLKLQQGGQAAEEARAELERMAQGLDKLPSHTIAFSEALTKIGSSLMQVSMAINGLKNIGNIWSNEDLSTGEKLLQTMTSLSMILPVITMFTNKQRLAEISLAAAKLLHIGGSSGVTAAEWAEAAAKEGSAAATWSLIWPIGVLMAAILALIAVIWLIVKAYQAWQENSPEGKLKTAKEELEKTTEAAENAKTAFEDLKTTIENYDSAIDSLKGLVKGTDEFKAAVEKANEEAKKLIDTNDELKGKYHYNAESGLIEFDEGVLDNLKTSGGSRYNAAETSKLVAANNVSKAEGVLALSTASKKDDVNLISSYGKSAGMALTGGVGATIGATTFGINLVKAINDSKKNQEQNEALAHFSQIIADNGKISLDQANAMNLLSDSEYDLINSLGLTQEELSDLTSQMNANTKAILENNKQIIANSFKNNKNYENSKNKEELNTVLAKQLEPVANKIYESTYKKGKGISDKDAQKKYAEAMGYEWIKSDGDSGKYKDSSGEEVSVNNDIAREFLAEQDALKSLTDTIQSTDSALTKLHKNSDDIVSQAVLSKMTKGDFSDVDLAEKGKTYTVNDLQGQFSDEEFKAIYTSLGYSTAQEFANSFNQELTNLTTLDDAINAVELSDENKTKYSEKLNNLFSDLTASEAQNLSSGINTLISSFGEEVGTNFIDVLDDMTKNLSEEEKKIVTKEFGKINDIGDADQWDSFLKSIEDSEKITEKTKRSFEGYVDTAKNVANAVSDISFDEFVKGLGDVQKTLDTMSDGNRVVKKEEYDKLIKNGADASQFIRTLSGDFEYIGSMTTLMSDIEENTRDSFDSAIDSFIQSGEAALQSAQNADALADKLYGLKGSVGETGEELTESQKFFELIKNLFQKAINKIKEKVLAFRDWAVSIWNKIKTNIIDPIAKGLKAFYDKIISIWNGFIDGLFGVINGFIRAINSILQKLGREGFAELDPNAHHAKSSAEIEAENATKNAREKRKESHEEYMTKSEKTVSFIQSYGSEVSESKRKEIEDKTAEQLTGILKERTEAEERLKNANISSEDKEYYTQLKEDLDAEIEQINKIQDAWHQVDIAQINTATSLEDFNHKVEQARSTGTVDYNIIADGLKTLGSSYDNCSEEILNYNQALASGSEELVTQTEALLRNSIAVGEMSEALDLEAESVEEQAKELISVNELSEENYKVATKVAVLNQSMNKGVQDLVDNWSDYKKTLKNSEKGTEDYANAALKTKKALAQLLGVTDEDFIPDGFLELPGVMELIDKAAQGDEDAINSLGATMAKATIEAMQFNEEMKQLGENDVAEDLNEETFYKYQTEVLNGINTLIEGIENGTIQAGENISTLMGDTTESWIKSLNQMAYATGMSVEEMNSLLNELGVQADVTVKDKEVETSVPEYTTYEMDGENVTDDKNTDLTSSSGGYHIAKKSVTVQTGTKKVKGSISVAQINMGDKKGTPPTITYAGRDNVSSSALTPSSSSSGNSSSSSSSTPTTKAASHTHEINRYTAEENAIDGLSKQYEKLNNIKDKSFGKGKIQAIENEIKALKELKQASTNYMDAIVGDGNGKRIAEAIYRGENIGDLLRNGAISGNLGSDYRALSYGISASGKQVEYTAKDEAGNEWLASRDYDINDFNAMFGTNIHFDLDAFGNIQNADSIRNQLQQLKNNESDAYSSIADPTADSTTRYNERMAYIDEILDRMDTFGDSINTLSEQSEEYLDYITQLQEKNAELITSKMELGVELGDKSLRRIDRALKVLGNDIYRNTEAMTKAFELNDQKIESSQEKAQSYQEMMNEAERRFALYQENPLNEDAITPAEYAEMLSTAEEGFESIADEMREYMNYFYDMYSGMQDYWEEKISRITKQMEDSIKVLEYYQKVLELTGRSGDYELIGKILEGQAETAKTIFETSQARAELAKKEWERQKDDLEKAKLDPTLSKDLLDTLENMTELAYEKYVEAVETAREDSLNYLEITQTAFENKIKQMRVESEKFLTNGSDFDSLNKSMERQKSLSEDYLTKTNQLYETNKMLRQLNQDIDKTDSVMAKNKLKAFADEISAMQDQEKLSNTSLEIAKAKYEILQAQIALEDAQNAKSTVQLRRDSEGNYGYVYTADEEAVNNAQQNLEDKVNALYNLGKKASEDFAERMIQLEQEEWAEIEEIANNTILTTDEKNIKIAELQEYYNAKRQALSEQYEEANLALQQGAVAQRLLITDKFNTENLDIEKVAAEARAEAWTESFTTTIKDQNTYEAHFKQLASQLKSEMQKLDDKREQHEQATKTGNREIERSIEDVTEAVDDLSYEILKRDGLLDSYSNVLNASNALRDSFKRQYERARELANQYSNAADRASDLYVKTVDLVNAQVALNHANNGATHVEWGPDGVTADYNGNIVSSNGNSSSRDSIVNSSINQRATSHYDQAKSEAYDTITDYVRGMKLRKGDYNRWGEAFKTSGVLEEWLLLDPSQREHIKNIYGYKTGGYTGSWNGPDVEENGKLAFLHQKELVLNADDTENMLNAVKLIRQISESIDLQAAVQSSYSVGAIQFPGNNQVLQQEVTIHAEFPNATDHNEIEEAFNSLVNRASQYANRN